jgi:pyruvate kinase
MARPEDDLASPRAGALPATATDPATCGCVGPDSPPRADASAGGAPWDPSAVEPLVTELLALRDAMRAEAAGLGPADAGIHPSQRASATNLAHYLALRRHDVRALQERLAALGLSSLGRAETHALANVELLLAVLHRLIGRSWPMPADEPAAGHDGRARLTAHAHALFGPEPPGRRVRIMVTLPSEAASDGALVQALVDGGMDVARINCAHDDAAAWAAMAGRVRHAARRARREVRVLMDLGGPKLRTGPLPDGAPVLKLRPRRDAYGRVVTPACLGLLARAGDGPLPGVDAQVVVDPDWLRRLEPGATIELVDARGARRRLTVADRVHGGVRVASDRTVYLVATTTLRHRAGGSDPRTTAIDGLPVPEGAWLVQRGDRLRLLKRGPAQPAEPARAGRRPRPAAIECTLPDALDSVRKDEHVWFDDGRIGGVVRRTLKRAVEIEILHAPDGGARLRADKGINLPDTRLELPALTAQDREDLASVVRHADLVGLSFAQSAGDVEALQGALAQHGRPDLPIVLKIETRRGFETLPRMMLAAMRAPVHGVMIARGDLAVECGYERLAEVQEEILWACEAAHTPAVWATQVLESMARTGLPARAEITDAAMGARAECVMLNKGPHIVDALRALDDILRRMQTHQAKKRPLLRALHAWARSPGDVQASSPVAGSH